MKPHENIVVSRTNDTFSFSHVAKTVKLEIVKIL